MKGMTVFPRHVLGALPTYVAGKPPAQIPGLTSYKMSSNENPFAPVPAVAEIVQRELTHAHQTLCRYPDPLYTGLRLALGETFSSQGLDPEDVVVGAGSLGALTQLVAAFAGTNAEGVPDEVIYAWRSFEAYPIMVRTAGAQDVPVPLTADGRHDLAAMLAAVTERTRMILLCTPNNPTGPVLSTAEVEDFLGSVPPHVLVVLDEAYTEFVQDPEAVNGLEIFSRYPNLALLRTFSKAHGLAGLRIGYSVTHPEVTQHVRKVATPFATSALAEQAAITSLQHLDEVLERVNRVISERQRVLTELASLRKAGALPSNFPEIPETHANFFWLPVGHNTQVLTEACGRAALAVRGFGVEGVRVSIGEPEANDRLLEVISDLDHSHWA